VTNYIVESSAVRAILGRQRRGVRLHAGVIAPAVAAIDAVSLLAAVEISRIIYNGGASDVLAYSGISLVTILTFLFCGRTWHLYRYSGLMAPIANALHIALAVALGVGSVTILLFLMKEATYSRAVLVIFAFFAPALLICERLAVAWLLRRAIAAGVISGRRVVVVGDEGELDRIPSSSNFQFGISEVGRIALSLANSADGLSEHDRSSILQAIKLARVQRASEYALFLPWSSERAIAQVTEMLRATPRAIRLYPDQKTRAILSHRANRGPKNGFSIELQPEPLSFTDRIAKRCFDITIATVGLIALSPILASVALFIKLDSPGPVFFRQSRRGFDDHEFRIWKFRTMNVLEDDATIQQARRGDSRVTRLGRVLRRTSVDELPQLLNVLKGEMSIVGPRPHAVAHDRTYDDLISQYALRRHVKPGLTGLAQVNGLRGETSTQEQMEMRVEKDLWYINNWSFGLDAKIVAQTLVALAVNEAY